MKKFVIAVLSVLMVFALAACGASSANSEPEPASEPGKGGQKAYVLEVSDGSSNARYSGKTDAPYLSGLLDELAKEEDFSYQSTEGEYGVYITSVNGTAASDSEHTYWAIYVNGESGQYGADLQPVNDGDQFALKLEKYEDGSLPEAAAK